MAKRDIAGFLTGTPSKYAETMLKSGSLAGDVMGGRLKGMLGGGKTVGLSPREEIEKGVRNFDNLDAQGKRDLIGRLQASGETSLAGQLASQLKADLQKVKTEAGIAKQAEDAKLVANSLPPEYSQLAKAIEGNVKGSLEKGIDILSRERKATPKVDKKIVNLVNTKNNKTVGTAVEVDGQLFNSQGQLISPEELEGFGISASYVKPPTPLVSTAENPALKAQAERRSQLFTPLTTVAESTAVIAESAVNEKRSAQTALRAIDNNAKTGAISAVSSDLAQIGQDVFQNLGIQVPQGWSKLTNSKAQYQMISAQGLLPRIEEQGRGFTDTEREYFLKEVIPSYKQAWQFNELASHLQDESATLKIAEAGFANNRRAWHVSEDRTPTQAHAVVWNDYTSKLPYNKLKKNAKRMVGNKEVTYDKYQIMSDKSKLWQYWSSGQEPTGFTLIDAEGNPVDYTFYELNNLEGFEGKTAREILQLFDDADRLSGAIYK